MSRVVRGLSFQHFFREALGLLSAGEKSGNKVCAYIIRHSSKAPTQLLSTKELPNPKSM